jgi:hydrogenase maturation protease
VNVCVVGVGTPHGDDAAGLETVARLAEQGLPLGVSPRECQRPGVDLPELLRDVDAAVIVDAMRSGQPLGTVSHLPLDVLPRTTGLSSHAMGVGEGLALARALDCCPDRIALVGIEASAEQRDDLSPAVDEALPAAIELIRSLLDDALQRREWRSESRDA